MDVKKRAELLNHYTANFFKKRHQHAIQANVLSENITEALRNKNIPEEDIVERRREILKSTGTAALRRRGLELDDFERLELLGSGGFGEVTLVRYKETGRLYALKKISKQHVLKHKDTLFHLLNEQQIMTFNLSDRLVKLWGSFQDDEFIYFVMDFMQGGDFMTLVWQRRRFSEEEAKFYAAEIIVALHELHQNEFIHRDIKPENILIRKDGHLVLADFGLSHVSSSKPSEFVEMQLSQMGQMPEPSEEDLRLWRYRMRAKSKVGTPDFAAPELLTNRSPKYDHAVDFWSLGIIIYLMVYGFLPFRGRSKQELLNRIVNYRLELNFPSRYRISPELRDLISNLLKGQRNRLGRKNINEIFDHPWFEGIDWENLHNMTPPHVPEFESETDVSRFKDVLEYNAPIRDHTLDLREFDSVFNLYTFNEIPRE
ncbi:hypothetical protein PCE1_004343 [Barthelona sp. PCE]